MNLHLLTFGDTKNYGGALTRMLVQSTQWLHQGQRVFKTINIHNEKTLVQKYPEFWQAHGEWIKINPRGFGYWIWKPWLIYKTLESLDKNDILLYIDAGCQLNANAYNRLQEYLGMANKYYACCFELGFLDRHWCKSDTISHILGPDTHIKNPNQIMATCMFLKATQNNITFAKTWYETCTRDNYVYVNDQPNSIPNDIDFQEHRHDQAIFSLLVKKHNIGIHLKDETYWNPNWYKDGLNFPIWATRNNTSIVI